MMIHDQIKTYQAQIEAIEREIREIEEEIRSSDIRFTREYDASFFLASIILEKKDEIEALEMNIDILDPPTNFYADIELTEAILDQADLDYFQRDESPRYYDR